VTAGSSGPAILTRAGRPAHRGGDGAYVTLAVAGERLRASGASFVQGNGLLWTPLVEAVRAACLAGPGAPGSLRFAELYAGIGFFTLALARAGARGVALESDRSALADLRHNLSSAGLAQHVEVLAGRVETRGDLVARMSDVDVVLMDPPRAGLDARVRAGLLEAAPPRIVYLSCDPATLARDLAELVGDAYAIETIRAFDLFPQTPHVETLVRLDRVD